MDHRTFNLVRAIIATVSNISRGKILRAAGNSKYDNAGLGIGGGRFRHRGVSIRGVGIV
jgi:hypothetical protein